MSCQHRFCNYQEDSPIHALRCEAVLDAPLEVRLAICLACSSCPGLTWLMLSQYLLVLINEVTLFKEWLPFFGGSELLARPSR